MPRRRHFRSPGVPDFIALALLLPVIGFGWSWWRSVNKPQWQQTGGRIVSGSVSATHFNAEAYEPKVSVVYEYTVGGSQFVDDWTGYWPVTESPNALPPGQLEMLVEPEHPVTVFYDPARPWVNRIHGPGRNPAVYAALFVVSVLLAVSFYLKLYPIWRGRE